MAKVYSEENIGLKISRHGKDHDCLTHCNFCEFYEKHDFYFKEGLLKWFDRSSYMKDIPICSGCLRRLESGKYEIISLKTSRQKLRLKKFPECVGDVE